uniref:RELL2 n=1 Tax=Corvus moneduloides TaxID=1196302 RepID=A0A8U7P7T1_CORMO
MSPGHHGESDPQHSIIVVFLLVLVFFIMGLVGFLICHVLKKKGYRCRTFRDELDPDDKEGVEELEDDEEKNDDTVEKIVKCIIQNQAFVPTAAARTGGPHITTRCTWAPRRPPASTAARGRGTRCSARGGPRRAKAGCILERPPSSQWAGTQMSFARRFPAATSTTGSSPVLLFLPRSPQARLPLAVPRGDASASAAGAPEGPGGSRSWKCLWCVAGCDAPVASLLLREGDSSWVFRLSQC